MTTDTLRVDVPSGKNELAVLRSTKVGDVRHGLLFPAIPGEVDWTCVRADEFEWRFDGTFCGVKMATIDIVMVNSALVLTVKEAA